MTPPTAAQSSHAAKVLSASGARKGGIARWANLTPDARRALGRKLAAIRIAKRAARGGGVSSP